MAEIAKKFDGGAITAHTRKKFANDAMWDTRVYNHLTKKWEREGRRLTYKQAYNRLNYRQKTNPYAEFQVFLIPGRRPARKLADLNGTEVDA